VLGTIAWDLGRFGVQFVASPRHAGGLVITGPVSKNTEPALKKTWDAMPEPKIAIAVGTSAVSGGPFAGHSEVPWARLLLCRLICSSPGWPTPSDHGPRRPVAAAVPIGRQANEIGFCRTENHSTIGPWGYR
jgi:hypothetical protein